METFCTECDNIREHRSKIGGFVCNTCDKINYPVFLKRLNDGLINIGNRVVWIEWSNDGTGKKIHNNPQMGCSLCINPFVIKSNNLNIQSFPTFSWMTTEITKIISDTLYEKYRTIKFKTKNSEYILHLSLINN